MVNDIIVETTDLVKVYKQGHVRAVDGLNLRVHRGEIYALIGANGSGKTTAIKMLTGILAPTSGQIRIFGMMLPQYRGVVSRRIGVSPQEYAIYQDLTVEENMRFFANIYGIAREECDKKMLELLHVMRLDDKRNAIGVNLSGGMKRRLSICCTLITSPELIFFDEATVGVDPVLRRYFWTYFNSLKEQGITIILTSHVMDEAERADRIGLMRAGRLIDEGTPVELKTRNDATSIEEVFIKLSEGVEIRD